MRLGKRADRHTSSEVQGKLGARAATMWAQNGIAVALMLPISFSQTPQSSYYCIVRPLPPVLLGLEFPISMRIGVVISSSIVFGPCLFEFDLKASKNPWEHKDHNWGPNLSTSASVASSSLRADPSCPAGTYCIWGGVGRSEGLRDFGGCYRGLSFLWGRGGRIRGLGGREVVFSWLL